MLYGIESYIAVPLNRRDGSYFGTLCALDPLPAKLSDNDFAVFHLLSQLIAFELEAEEQQQRRATALRAMEDFIAIAAHDLRQPLTALQGRAELLERRARRGMPSATLADGAAQIAAQARRAIALSDTLLDVARIEAGSLQLEPSPFDLVALALQLIDELQVAAPNHTFQLSAPDTLPLVADERRLSQVLRNLLTNAAKYAPAERGPIHMSIKPDADGGAPTARLCVRDAGNGVADADLPLLFERRYRTAGAVTQGISGSGLGLYIARQIVEAHGGAIWAEHAPGGGLAVCLHLPLTPGGNTSSDK